MATVLVADDEADLRELVRINLALDGHRVLLAADGDEALRLVRDERPDVIVLDVMMPKRDGWDVLGTIKAEDPARAHIPVVMLTARVDELSQVRGGIEGAIHYITKPFAVVDLRAAVTQVLQGEPEPVKRRQAQWHALARLARFERTGQPPAQPNAQPGSAPPARPRLTRLEGPPQESRPPRRRRPPVAPSLAGLSTRQFELLGVVGRTLTVREAAERLGVSRSYVYASLRRMARKLGLGSGPELVGMARQGAFAYGE